MFWALKLSFVADILAFFDLATFLAIFWKIWPIFFLSSGHPVYLVGVNDGVFDGDVSFVDVRRRDDSDARNVAFKQVAFDRVFRRRSKNVVI